MRLKTLEARGAPGAPGAPTSSGGPRGPKKSQRPQGTLEVPGAPGAPGAPENLRGPWGLQELLGAVGPSSVSIAALSCLCCSSKGLRRGGSTFRAPRALRGPWGPQEPLGAPGGPWGPPRAPGGPLRVPRAPQIGCRGLNGSAASGRGPPLNYYMRSLRPDLQQVLLQWFAAAFNPGELKSKERLIRQKCAHVFQKDLPSSSESVVSIETVSSAESSAASSDQQQQQQQQQQQRRSHRGRRGGGSAAVNGEEATQGMQLVRRVLESWGRTVSSLRRSSRMASSSPAAAATTTAAAAAAAAGAGASASARQRRNPQDRDNDNPRSSRRRSRSERVGPPGAPGAPRGTPAAAAAAAAAHRRSAEAEGDLQHGRYHREDREESEERRPLPAPAEVARRTASFFQRRIGALYEAPGQQEQQQQQKAGPAAAAAAAASGNSRRRDMTPVVVPLGTVSGIGLARDHRGAPRGAPGGPTSPARGGPSFQLRPSYAADFLLCPGSSSSAAAGRPAAAARQGTA
ncbi:hypothetical protein ETH_00026380 [Eimeria tenella]|uniref:Uncharacterized protein n=1 Tax=Eimeria tenella TaxID=5802 RepID=U6KSA7_EIMTE|nr:hypothetical protein ETH_00026380 [Eimeria tenella]CDJ38313.1 hypothetical protein ETH_00026380 [Eimeria tenella]|eukprot:XP_013229151.1 hypothetical protein ETH_00026380 [Eimeria tenella]